MRTGRTRPAPLVLEESRPPTPRSGREPCPARARRPLAVVLLDVAAELDEALRERGLGVRHVGARVDRHCDEDLAAHADRLGGFEHCVRHGLSRREIARGHRQQAASRHDASRGEAARIQRDRTQVTTEQRSTDGAIGSRVTMPIRRAPSMHLRAAMDSIPCSIASWLSDGVCRRRHEAARLVDHA